MLAGSALARSSLRRYLQTHEVFQAGSGHWHHYVVKKTRSWLGLKVNRVGVGARQRWRLLNRGSKRRRKLEPPRLLRAGHPLRPEQPAFARFGACAAEMVATWHWLMGAVAAGDAAAAL